MELAEKTRFGLRTCEGAPVSLKDGGVCIAFFKLAGTMAFRLENEVVCERYGTEEYGLRFQNYSNDDKFFVGVLVREPAFRQAIVDIISMLHGVGAVEREQTGSDDIIIYNFIPLR